MAACPNCHQSVEILDKHLGTLYTCPQCNAVFFVDWNGQPELANHEIEQPVEEAFVPPLDNPQAPFEAPFEAAPIEPTIVGDIPQDIPEYQAPQEEPYLAPADEIPPGSEFQSADGYGQDSIYSQNQDQYLQQEQNGGQYQAQENALTPVQQTPAASEPEMDAYDFNQALGQPTPQPMKTMSSDNSDFSDVADFANANTSSGPLSYMVIIDGIESSHLLKQLREAMTDSRFGWDVASIISSMAGGRMILTGLSPAKASVLINRIKYLPVKISWRQDVLSSS